MTESGRVQNLQGLAKQLNKEKGLKLTHFVHAESLDKYYAFLYQKEILPINLCIEENLRSFSTVIQSFSRANNLRLKNSKDLKNFLFESDKENLMGEYKQHRADLLALMKDFRSLKEKIDSIDGKQRALNTLKEKHQLFERVDIEHNQMEVLFHRDNFKKAEKNKTDSEKKIKTLKSQRGTHEKAILGLKMSVETSEKKKGLNDEKIDQLTELIRLEEQLKPIIEQLVFWKDAQFPEISKQDQKLIVDFKVKNSYSLSELKEMHHSSIELLNSYGSFEEVNGKRSKQRDRLEKLKNQFLEKNEQKGRLLKVLDVADENSLLKSVLKSGKELTEEQETVFIALLGLGFKKPIKPQNGTRFISDDSILNKVFITNDVANNGVWLNFGRLSEFYVKKGEKRLFADPKTFGQKLNKLRETLTEQLIFIQTKLVEIEKIQNGEGFKQRLFEEKFDLRLTDNTQINQLKTAIVLFLKKEEQIKLLNENNAKKIKLQSSLIKKLQLKNDKNKNDLLDELKAKRITFEAEWKEFNSLLSDVKTKLAVANTNLNNLSNQLQLTERIYLELENDFSKIRESFGSNFPEFDLTFIKEGNFNRDRYDILVSAVVEAEKGYKNEYIKVVSEFEETKNKNDININLQIQSNTFDFSTLESTLLGPRIKHLDNIKPEMDEMNRTRLEFVNDLYEKMIKIFSKTEDQYNKFDTKVKDLNVFFKDKKISEQYYFSIEFSTEKCLDINWIYSLREKSSEIFMKGEIPFGESADDFIEKFFQKLSNQRQRINLSDLLDPKSYFQLSTKMEDENGEENSGSTGETYTALVLLGIARLSLVQKEERNGLRFVILEESSNLDDANFNLFPKIAKDYKYQIITMTPKPFGSDSTEGWYLHQLIKGKENKYVNYPIPASYFKTKNARKKLSAYIKEQEK